MSENVPPGSGAADNETGLLKVLGKELKRLRKQCELTQEELEEISGIGRFVIKELEAGKERTRREGTLEALSDALGETRKYLDEIADGSRKPPAPAPKISRNPIMRKLDDLREEFDDKFSTLEEYLVEIGADLAQQRKYMENRFDALYQRINPPEVTIDPVEHHPDQDAPEE